MKNSQSLIFKIHLLTALLTLFITFFILAIFVVVYFNEKRVEAKKSIKIYHHFEKHERLGYKILKSKDEINQLKSEAKNLLIDDEMINIFALGNIKLLTMNHYYYIYLKPYDVYLKSTYQTSSTLHYVGFFLLIIVMIISLLLRYIKTSLLPLQSLSSKIKKFGEGDMTIDTRSNRGDEVAEVGNAFYDALVSIKTLENSRKVFIRNISHELKTPLTKNRLILHTLTTLDKEIKNKLLNNNQQINTIIDTISQFDSLESQYLKLNKKQFNLIDLVEEAMELSSVEEEKMILTIESTSKQSVDFEKFVLALKNLINNAYFHSNKQPITITITSTTITISNPSLIDTPLDFEKIKTPFIQEDKNSIGMGLGLYIIDNIIKMHHLIFAYDYQKGCHLFRVSFKA